MKSLVSIIIPVYNSEKYLSKCLESILSQSYKNFEILIVCDKSNDNSYEICKQYAENYSNIKVFFRDEKLGVSSARNVGIKNMSKDSVYTVFVDADDWVEHDYLKTLVENMEKYDADVSMCAWQKSKPTNKTLKMKKEKITLFSTTEAIKELFIYQKLTTALWHKMFKSCMVRETIFVEDIVYAEDMLYCYKMFIKSNKFVYTSQKLYHYIQHKSSTVASKLNYNRLTLIKATEFIINDLHCRKMNECEFFARGLFFVQLFELAYFIKRDKFPDQDVKTEIVNKALANKKYYYMCKKFYRFPSKLIGMICWFVGIK